MKKLLLLLVLFGTLLIVAAYWVNPSSTSSGDVLYTFAPVERGSMTEVVSATGPLSPSEIIPVSSLIPGQVESVYPQTEVNQQVKENDPLVKLDQGLAQVKLEQAQAAVEMAKRDVDRAEALRNAAQIALDFQKGLSKEIQIQAEVDKATYQLKAADAALEAARSTVVKAQKVQREAQIGLDKTVVRAPVAGVIIERNISVGQIVGPQAPIPLFIIARDLGKMQVNAQVAEGDVGKVRPGLDATFTVYAYADQNVKFEGKVKEIRHLPTNIQGAVFYTTVISASNRRSQESREGWQCIGGIVASARFGPFQALPWIYLKPENSWMLLTKMTANVDIVRRRHENAWKMPTEALNIQLDEHYKTDAARSKLEKWRQRQDHDEWKYVWVLDSRKKPWPIFARLGGVNKMGETGIKDSQFNEVLDWDPELTPAPDPKNPETYPRVILSAPPYGKAGILERFDRPNQLTP